MLQEFIQLLKQRTSWCLFYTAAFIWGLGYWERRPRDPDLGWHLLGGAWISAHGSVPHQDFINTFNHKWHDYHWLIQYGMYQLYERGGYDLLRVALGIVAGCICLGLVRLIQLSTPRLGLIPLAACLGSFYLLNQTVEIRPQLVALLFLVITQLVLTQRPARGALILLVTITCLLVNIHVYWVFVPLLWFAYRCLPRFFRKRAMGPFSAWGGLAVLSLCGLISPYGIFGSPGDSIFSNYYLILEYLTTPAVLRHKVSEFRGAFAMGGMVPFVLLAYLLFLSHTFHLKRAMVRSGDVLASWATFALVVSASKYQMLFGSLSVLYVNENLFRVFGRRGEAWVVPLLTLFLALSLVRAVTYYPNEGNQVGEASQLYPIEACTQIPKLGLTSRVRDHVRVLTHFNDGGWCAWTMYQNAPAFAARVTTDNRTQWVPGEHYEKSFNLYFGQQDWLQTLLEWNPEVAVVKRGQALEYLLRLMPDRWSIVYSDDYFELFARAR